jgi:hypothetical protein
MEDTESVDTQPLLEIFDDEREQDDFVSSVVRRFYRSEDRTDEDYELQETYLYPMENVLDVEAVKIGMVDSESAEDVLVEPEEFQIERNIHARLQEEIQQLQAFERETKIKEAKDRYTKQKQKLESKLVRLQEKQRQQEQLQHEKSYTNWKRNEQRIKKHLERSDTRIVDIIDENTNVDHKRWQLIWKHEPQFINFLFHELVLSYYHHQHIIHDCHDTNRLSITVTLFDRLGGSPLTFKLADGSQSLYEGIGNNTVHWLHDQKKQRYLHCTVPFTIPNDRFHVDLQPHQLFDFICPADVDVQPRMVFMFELYDLTVNAVIAWGLFPAVNSNLTLIKSGHFKVPLIRGAVDTREMNSYEKWTTIKDRFWFGSLYFEIGHNMTTEYLTEAELQLEHKETVIDVTGGGVINQLDSYEPEPDRAIIWNDENLKRAWFDKEKVVFKQYEDYQPEQEPVPVSDPPVYLQSVDIPNQNSIWVQTRPLYQEKMIYLKHTLKFDLGLYDFRTIEFWLVILLAVFVLYVRIWPHYFGQWFCLSVSNTPMSSNTWYPWHVYIDFRVDFHSALFIVGYVICGTAFNIMASILMMICVAVLQSRYAVHHYLPNIVYRFAFLYACAVSLDPIFIFITDVIFNGFQPIGEAFMLSQYYIISENSSIPGIFLTIAIYFVFMICQLIIIYHYVLHVHMNGRLWDLYHRVHAKEYELARSLPHDCTVPQHVMEEISIQVDPEDAIANSSLQRRIVVLEIEPEHYAMEVLDRLRRLLDSCYHDEEQTWVSKYVYAVPLASEVSSTIEPEEPMPCRWTQDNANSRQFEITNRKLIYDLLLFDHISDEHSARETYFIQDVIDQFWLLDQENDAVLACRMMKCLDLDEYQHHKQRTRNLKQIITDEFITPIRNKFKQRQNSNINAVSPVADSSNMIESFSEEQEQPNLPCTFSYEMNEQIHRVACKKRKYRIAKLDSCFLIKNNVEERFYREFEKMDKMKGQAMIVYNVNLSTNERTILSTFVQTPLSQLCHVPAEINKQADCTTKRSNHCRLDKEEYWISRADIERRRWLQQLTG